MSIQNKEDTEDLFQLNLSGSNGLKEIVKRGNNSSSDSSFFSDSVGSDNLNNSEKGNFKELFDTRSTFVPFTCSLFENQRNSDYKEKYTCNLTDLTEETKKVSFKTIKEPKMDSFYLRDNYRNVDNLPRAEWLRIKRKRQKSIIGKQTSIYKEELTKDDQKKKEKMMKNRISSEASRNFKREAPKKLEYIVNYINEKVCEKCRECLYKDEKIRKILEEYKKVPKKKSKSKLAIETEGKIKSKYNICKILSIVSVFSIFMVLLFQPFSTANNIVNEKQVRSLEDSPEYDENSHTSQTPKRLSLLNQNDNLEETVGNKKIKTTLEFYILSPPPPKTNNTYKNEDNDDVIILKRNKGNTNSNKAHEASFIKCLGKFIFTFIRKIVLLLENIIFKNL